MKPRISKCVNLSSFDAFFRVTLGQKQRFLKVKVSKRRKFWHFNQFWIMPFPDTAKLKCNEIQNFLKNTAKLKCNKVNFRETCYISGTTKFNSTKT